MKRESEEAVEEFLKSACANWHAIEKLSGENKLIELEYEGNKYYMGNCQVEEKASNTSKNIVF